MTAFINNIAPGTVQHSGRPLIMDYRTNGADTLRIAATVQVAMNSSLTVEDLAGFGVERLRELWSKCPPSMQAMATNEAVGQALARAARSPAQQPQQQQPQQRVDKYAGYSLNEDAGDEFSGYSLNGEDEGELLRAVTALKNAVQSAGPGALVTLGLATLEGWRQQVAQAVAATSARVNAAMPTTMRQAPASGDKFAGYSLNEFDGYDMNAVEA